MKAGGVNVEAHMVVSEDDIPDGIGNWTVENLKFSVEQPIEAIVTKNELQHLSFLCKSEVDSFGRLAASILHLLKLEGSIGPRAINQLSNLGSEGLDKFLSPRKLNRSENGERSPILNGPGKSLHSSKQTTVTLLEKEVEDTESKCAALIADITESQSLQHLDQAKKLGQQIKSLRRLLKDLKTQR